MRLAVGAGSCKVLIAMLALFCDGPYSKSRPVFQHTNSYKEGPMEDEVLKLVREMNLDEMSAWEKIATSRRLIKLMTNNPKYPNPDPPLEVLTASTDEFERACREVEIAQYHEQVCERKLKEAEMAFLEATKDQTRN